VNFGVKFLQSTDILFELLSLSCTFCLADGS